MNNSKKEIKATILIFLINVVAALIALGFNYIFESVEKLKYFGVTILAYVALNIIFGFLDLKLDNKIIKIIATILGFPVAIVVGMIAVLIPALMMQLYLILYLFLAVIIPLAVYRLDEKFQFTNFSIETWIYLMITIGVICAISFNKQIQYITFRFLPFTAIKKEQKDRSKVVELCNYIVSIPNIKLVIYSLYFIALLIFNFFTFQDSSFFDSRNIDKAILQSFITFLAFERMFANLKSSEFRPSKLLSILNSSVKYEIEDITGKKDKTAGNNI